ncbi:MAG: GNAT family N-acetyltransferase [Xanthobacteraceae bacterium]
MTADCRDAVVRPMRAADLTETLDMWVAGWQAAYPDIDFEARREWTRSRIAELERSGSMSLIAVLKDRIVGAVVFDPHTGYLDQIIVATAWQGRGIAALLLAQARRAAPSGLDLHVNQDNARAIRFYRKHGFIATGEDANPRSGAPVFRMSWRPANAATID